MTEKKNILAIDDDPVTLKILVDLLLADYNIITSKSVADATVIMNKKRPDLILLDIEMPDISGFEFLHSLRKDPKFMKIPVLIISSHFGKEFVDRVERCGASGLVSKPIDKDNFFQKLEHAFEHPVKTIFDL